MDPLAKAAAALKARRVARFPPVEVEGRMSQPVRVVPVDVPPEFREQELARTAPIEPQPHEAVAQQQVPQSVPVTQFTPPEDDADLEAAREADRESRFAAGMELAGRQLVGGITRTPVPQGLGANPSEVPHAMARAKSKREQAAAVLAARRQSTMDASTLDLQKSQAEKNRRDPEPRGGIDYTESRAAQQALEAKKLEETTRHNKAMEAKPRGSGAPKDKTLPVSTLTELADFDSAAKELDRLAGRFVELEQGGYWAKIKAKGSEALGMQGTDAALYASEAKRAMQGVGKILEGGKLAAGDELKYRALMPEAGDSPERLHSKVQGLKTMLADLKAGRIGAYRAAGYKTGDMGDAKPETKTVGGKTYKKVPGGWDPI
jgi:hypothetical protein